MKIANEKSLTRYKLWLWRNYKNGRLIVYKLKQKNVNCNNVKQKGCKMLISQEIMIYYFNILPSKNIE